MIPPEPSDILGAGRRLRPASPSDQQALADLIFFESHVHRHLDWRTPLDWLGSAPYWVLEDGRRISAALACPTDPAAIAWIRIFAFASHLSGLDAWAALWEPARAQLAEQGGATAAAIATQSWFEQILGGASFDLAGHIVLLEWNAAPGQQSAAQAGVSIRPMAARDLPAVAELDAAAFEPLWHNSLLALKKAYDQSSYASVAENESGLVGYQLSSGGAFGAHLARLAVLPEAQGRGVGTALVGELIQHMRQTGGLRVTVNTQENNAASLALYSRLGFRRTGERYPVYTLNVQQAREVHRQPRGESS